MQVPDAMLLHQGVASWRQLRALGVTWYAVDRAVLTGRLQRLRRGVYACPGTPSAVQAALARGAVLAGPSAAVHHRLQVVHEPGQLHVAVPRHWAHVTGGPGLVVHRTLRREEAEGPATDLQRTVLDCARWLPPAEALAVADSALRTGLLPGDLSSAAAAQRGPGSRGVREVVALADPLAESVLESLLRYLVLGLGVRVEPQVRIQGVGRVDLLLDGWLVLEADGYAHHSDRESYRNDRRRHVELVRQGYTLLRFSYEDVVHRPDEVVAAVRAVLGRGPAGCR